MRLIHAFAFVLGSALVGVVADGCGSNSDTPTGGDDGGVTVDSTAPPTGFVTDGSTVSCVPRNCPQLGVTCGKQADGCGGVIDCNPPNGCPAPQTCGGGGVPSQCGGNDGCVPKTCAALHAGCGQQGDGCGGVIDCDPPGGCTAPQFCGGGGPSQCGGGGDGGAVSDAGACVPITCQQANANCGVIGDGCGHLVNCGLSDGGVGCAAPAFCGGGGPNRCGTGSLPDGGTICKAKTCADFPSGTCGAQADGCGGLTADCTTLLPGGACPSGTICGGGGVPSQCGGNGGGGADASCTGLCTQIPTCAPGQTTALKGTVYAPNGVEPVPGAIVYVPNCPVQPFGANVSCDVCGAAQSGCPLSTVTTDYDGTFTLTDVPAGTNGGQGIPLVIQLGRWRRQITIPSVTACQTTTLSDSQTHLPTRSTASIQNGACSPNPNDGSDQGDIPLMAMATGKVDGLECVLRKIGIDDCEFTSPASVTNKPGRVRFYIENGPDTGASPGPGPQSPTSDAPNWADTSQGLINRPSELKLYDMILFACEGGADPNVVPNGTGGTSTFQQNLVDYTSAGGRVYTTHYSYTWLTNIQKGTGGNYSGPAPFSGTGVWNIDQSNQSPQAGVIDTTQPDGGVFAKGALFAKWLGQPTVNALCNGKGSPCTSSSTPPEIRIDSSRHDMNGVKNPPAEEWIHVAPTSGDYPNAPQHYTFNTPLVPADGGTVTQCGRVLYSDMHVHDMSADNTISFPSECDSAATTCKSKTGTTCPAGTHDTTSCNCGGGVCCKGDSLSPSERILEFMLFDLASCISQQAPPPPPTCTKKTCAQLGVQCGLSGDGCGGTQQCPPCAAGTTCGGAGVPNQCGAPTCTKTSCAAQHATCGLIGDGCGGSIDCGPLTSCAAGTTCGGGGTPNQCGAGACAPTTCSAQSAQCGPLANGCGGLLDCGPCPSGQACIANKCTPTNCKPTTCPSNSCGPMADGCGGLLDCGQCTAPLTCGGGGVPSQCGSNGVK